MSIFTEGTAFKDKVRILYNIAVVKWLYFKWHRLKWIDWDGEPWDGRRYLWHRSDRVEGDPDEL